MHTIMAEEDVTVLFVTHSTAMAKEFCTQGIVIRHADFSGEIEEGFLRHVDVNARTCGSP